jgi:predicted nucleotidyltransferase
MTSQICEGFAVETADGLIFTVKGLLHPPDRLVAYLRYIPDLQGDREREGTRHRRMYHFEEQERVLQARYPACFRRDTTFGIRTQGVPQQLVRTVYDPCHCVATLRRRGPADLVEEHALKLVELLRETAGVPLENLGISGSVLISMHQPDSDIDFIVYDEAAGRVVHQALHRLLDNPLGPVRRPNREEMAMLHAEHRSDTPLSADDFARLQERKVNEGYSQGRQYFIRFVKWPAEAGKRHGDRRFEPLGTATIKARVIDDQDAIFTPCRYVLAEVAVLEGLPVADVREIDPFRGRFSGQVRAEEWAVARGSLERVVSEDGLAYHCLVVGGRVGDHLLGTKQV